MEMYVLDLLVAMFISALIFNTSASRSATSETVPYCGRVVSFGPPASFKEAVPSAFWIVMNAASTSWDETGSSKVKVNVFACKSRTKFSSTAPSVSTCTFVENRVVSAFVTETIPFPNVSLINGSSFCAPPELVTRT